MPTVEIVAVSVALVGCIITLLKYGQYQLKNARAEAVEEAKKDIDVDLRLSKIEECLQRLVSQNEKYLEAIARIEGVEKTLKDVVFRVRKLEGEDGKVNGSR